MKKFGEKLSQIYYKRSKLKKKMKICIHYTYKIEGFEKKWKELIEENELRSNKWLQDLYEICSNYVPIYDRSLFLLK